MENNLKTFVLLAGLTALLMVIGQLLGGKSGVIIALVFALGINFFSYWFSDRIVLKMYRAEPLHTNEYPKIKAMVEELSVRAGIPVPGIYVIPHSIQ
jgi:heat shock protein HtpX